MTIAYTMAPGRGDTDLLLFQLAQSLADKGLRACGTVQINTECDGGGPCDMDVRALPDGPVIRISQSLGKDARGCRLDPAALETAVGLTMARLAEGADVLIVNKFGKHEAEGRGFRPAIAEAMSLGIPVLVGLNRLSAAAFQDFVGGMAEDLPPTHAALSAWADALAGAKRAEA